MFDCLPMDVIRFVILPYVANDYFARVAINSMVAWDEKVPAPLRTNAAAELEVALAAARMKPMLNDAEFNYITCYGMTEKERAEKAERKAVKIGEIFEFNVKYPILLKHNISFRTTAERKAMEFADPACEQYGFVSEATKALLITKANRLLEALGNNPFLFPVNGSTSTDKWTPINGAPARVIVDNSALLSAARDAAAAVAHAAEKERRSKPHWRRIHYGRRYYGGDPDDYDDDDDDESWEYGYFEGGGNVWVCLERKVNHAYDSPQEDEYDWSQEEEQPKVSRRGTVMEPDGWERVVSRRSRQ